jgi:hypothetical protein
LFRKASTSSLLLVEEWLMAVVQIEAEVKDVMDSPLWRSVERIIEIQKKKRRVVNLVAYFGEFFTSSYLR